MNNLTYSFIIPHHNSPELLNRCLNSIPQREDIQIIVVDDNSVEEKKPQVSRTDVEIIYIDAEHTKGAGHARNVGLAKAQGKWVLFADCDDYYADNFLDVLDQYKDESFDVVYFNYNFIDGVTGELLPPHSSSNVISNYSGTLDDITNIKYQNFPPWDKMVKREYITYHKMHFEEVINGNDIMFSLFVGSYLTSFVVLSSQRLYNYNKTNGSIGNKKQSIAEVQCRIDHNIKHLAFNKKVGCPVRKFTIMRVLGRILKHHGLLTLLAVIPSTLKHCLNKQFRNEWIYSIKRY